ncbi:MAG: hypothetical protein Q4F72_00865, partial [Desulfovibrionaceae bacterium]|nr:hypothetical protein [Desulfovibrionaceae bacterium]
HQFVHCTCQAFRVKKGIGRQGKLLRGGLLRPPPPAAEDRRACRGEKILRLTKLPRRGEYL